MYASYKLPKTMNHFRIEDLKTILLVSFATCVLRMIGITLFNSLNYICCDVPLKSVDSSQLEREKKHMFVPHVIHLVASLAIWLFLPNLFFNDNLTVIRTLECMFYTLIAHIVVVEPLYYVVHRLLHSKLILHLFHYFHHLSELTTPSTSLVQDFTEHLIYIATFGPALFLPFYFKKQNWISIAAYLLTFDVVNALGHSDFSYSSEYYTSESLIRYLFYSPEFHKEHHVVRNKNYGLFMPFWDYLFGTYIEPIKKVIVEDDKTRVDFAFIGHNCGLKHIISTPYVSIYNIYDKLDVLVHPLFDFKLCQIIAWILRFFMELTNLECWHMTKYNILDSKIGQVVALNRTPLEYLKNDIETNEKINNDLVRTIVSMNRDNRTKFFGLGNLNKLYSLNDGGKNLITKLKGHQGSDQIRILTGDTMTTASLYHSLRGENVDRFYFIGGTGKIGKALTKLLIERNNIEICIYSSSYERFNEIKSSIGKNLETKIMLSKDIEEIEKYSHVIVGKQLSEKERSVLIRLQKKVTVYDYNVPFFPIRKNHHITHKQIGVMRHSDKKILNGYFDASFGLDQGEIYPCYAGCIIGFIGNRTTDEVGEIDINAIDHYWEMGKKYGFSLVSK